VVRERKQADFADFGRTLDIAFVPEPTAALLAEARAFPQYVVEEADARATCAVMAQIVADNVAHHVASPTYRLLGEAYFTQVPDEVDALMRAGLHAYTAGEADWGRKR
jgi:hypothetical protein